jgi:hypothetical protein
MQAWPFEARSLNAGLLPHVGTKNLVLYRLRCHYRELPTYLPTYLPTFLPYTVEESPSWEANSHPAIQEIALVLRNPKGSLSRSQEPVFYGEGLLAPSSALVQKDRYNVIKSYWK